MFLTKWLFLFVLFIFYFSVSLKYFQPYIFRLHSFQSFISRFVFFFYVFSCFFFLFSSYKCFVFHIFLCDIFFSFKFSHELHQTVDRHFIFISFLFSLLYRYFSFYYLPKCALNKNKKNNILRFYLFTCFSSFNLYYPRKRLSPLSPFQSLYYKHSFYIYPLYSVTCSLSLSFSITVAEYVSLLCPTKYVLFKFSYICH